MLVGFGSLDTSAPNPAGRNVWLPWILRYSNAMRILAIALGFCLPLLLAAQPPSVFCGEQSAGRQSFSFVEGIDDYLVTLRINNISNGLLSGILAADYAPYTWEIRIPKFIRTPELAPSCLVDFRRPLLFNCGTGAVSAVTRLTADRTSIVQDVTITSFRISAITKNHRRLDFDDRTINAAQYHWNAIVEVNGKKSSQRFFFGHAQCRSEVP
jgi:hypothetical protein